MESVWLSHCKNLLQADFLNILLIWLGVEKGQLRRSWTDDANKITEESEDKMNWLTQQKGENILTVKEVSFEEAIWGLC